MNDGETLPGVHARVLISSSTPWLALLALMSGFFLSILDATIVNLALPSMYEELHTSLSRASWILTAYNLTFTALLIVAGRCADRYGRKRIFVVGMILFLFGSAASAFASSVSVLIAARVLQAIGAAALPTVSLTIIFQVFPQESRRRKALSVWGALSGLAAAAGPILGGILLQAAGWRWIFLINVPFCVLGILLVVRFVPESYGGDRRVSLSVPQLALSAVCILCLLLSILQGNEWGWTSQRMVVLYIATGGALLGFLVVQRQSVAPLFSAELFQKRSFTSTSLAMLLFCTALQGAYLVLPLYFIMLQQESQLTAAFTILAIPLTSFFASIFSGWLAALSSRTKSAFGLLLFAFGLLLLCQLPPQARFFEVVWRETLIGAGTGLCFSNFPAIALSELAPREHGVASGLFNTFRQLGLTLGVVLLVSILNGQSMHLQYSAFVFTWEIAALIAFCSVPFALFATSSVHPLHGVSDQGSLNQPWTISPEKGKIQKWNEPPREQTPRTRPRVAVLLTMKRNDLYTPQVVTQVIGTLQRMNCEVLLVPLFLPDEPSPFTLDGNAPSFKSIFEETLWPLLCHIDALHAGLCVCTDVHPTNTIGKAFPACQQTQESVHVTIERSLTALVKNVGIPVLLLEKSQQAMLVQQQEKIQQAFMDGRKCGPDHIPFVSVFTPFLSRCLSVHSIGVSTSAREAYHWLTSGYANVEEQLLRLVKDEFGEKDTYKEVDLISASPDSSTITHFMQKVQEEFGVDVGIDDVLEHSTPSQLSRFLAQRLENEK